MGIEEQSFPAIRSSRRDQKCTDRAQGERLQVTGGVVSGTNATHLVRTNP
jgi:hypothetical protein